MGLSKENIVSIIRKAFPNKKVIDALKEKDGNLIYKNLPVIKIANQSDNLTDILMDEIYTKEYSGSESISVFKETRLLTSDEFNTEYTNTSGIKCYKSNKANYDETPVAAPNLQVYNGWIRGPVNSLDSYVVPLTKNSIRYSYKIDLIESPYSINDYDKLYLLAFTDINSVSIQMLISKPYQQANIDKVKIHIFVRKNHVSSTYKSIFTKEDVVLNNGPFTPDEFVTVQIIRDNKKLTVIFYRKDKPNVIAYKYTINDITIYGSHFAESTSCGGFIQKLQTATTTKFRLSEWSLDRTITTNISNDTDNILKIKNDGLYVPAPILPEPPSIDVDISQEIGNSIIQKEDGIFSKDLEQQQNAIMSKLGMIENQSKVHHALSYFSGRILAFQEIVNTTTFVGIRFLKHEYVNHTGNIIIPETLDSVTLKKGSTYEIYIGLSINCVPANIGACLRFSFKSNINQFIGSATESSYNNSNSGDTAEPINDTPINIIHTPIDDEVFVLTAWLKQSGAPKVIINQGSSYIIIKELTPVIDPVQYVNTTQGIEDTPVGHIINYMGTKPPKHYLSCNGAIYALSDYPYLSDQIKSEFGSYNYFGGDGITTFAVPDLRDKFLHDYAILYCIKYNPTYFMNVTNTGISQKTDTVIYEPGLRSPYNVPYLHSRIRTPIPVVSCPSDLTFCINDVKMMEYDEIVVEWTVDWIATDGTSTKAQYEYNHIFKIEKRNYGLKTIHIPYSLNRSTSEPIIDIIVNDNYLFIVTDGRKTAVRFLNQDFVDNIIYHDDGSANAGYYAYVTKVTGVKY